MNGLAISPPEGCRQLLAIILFEPDGTEVECFDVDVENEAGESEPARIVRVMSPNGLPAISMGPSEVALPRRTGVANAIEAVVVSASFVPAPQFDDDALDALGDALGDELFQIVAERMTP